MLEILPGLLALACWGGALLIDHLPLRLAVFALGFVFAVLALGAASGSGFASRFARPS